MEDWAYFRIVLQLSKSIQRINIRLQRSTNASGSKWNDMLSISMVKKMTKKELRLQHKKKKKVFGIEEVLQYKAQKDAPLPRGPASHCC